MKKIKFFLLVLSFFGAQQIWAQARIFNGTNEKLVVSELKGLTEIVVNPKGSAVATFLPSDGVAKFNLARYEGFNKIEVGEATRVAKNGKIAIKNLSLDDGSVVEDDGKDKSDLKKDSKTFGSARTVDTGTTRSEIQDRSAGVVPASGLVLSNQSSYRLVVRDGVFKGSALASGQISKNVKQTPPGNLTFSIYFDPEEDSISSGRNHRWAVINKIIVEGQDTLYITDSDLPQISSGKEVEKIVKNELNINFQIGSSGENHGKMIPTKSRKVTRLKFQVGINYVSVDYLTKEGLLTRATLLLMVDDSKEPIVIYRRKDASLDSVDPSEIVFTNLK